MAIEQKFLVTWVDVEDALHEYRSSWPKGLHSVNAYFDGLDAYASEESISEIREKFEEWLSPFFQNDQVRLEGQNRFLPVRFVPDENGHEASPRPSFASGVSGGTEGYPEPSQGAPQIIGFHSFKGGVGRTLHLLAFWQVLAEQGKSALIIDMDLEAPGLTWWLQAGDSAAVDHLSILDFMRLVHGDGIDTACEIAKTRTRKERFPNANKPVHYFLPAFRDISQSFTPQILPQHLSNGSLNPWILVDALTRLGTVLGVDSILVDLRAGISEITSPILLDPRVRPVFVTTLTQQSLEGTRAVYLHRQKSLPEGQGYPIPLVIVSMRPRNRPDLNEPLVRFRLALGGGEDDSEPVEVLETPFTEALLVVRDLDEAARNLQGTEISKTVRGRVEELFRQPVGPLLITDADRKKLEITAKNLEFAEHSPSDSFLPIPALIALADDFSERAPQAVVVGSKGSGKTFTYLQLARMQTWGHFLNYLDVSHAGKLDLILPALWPKNLSQAQEETVASCLAACQTALGVKVGVDRTLQNQMGRDEDFSWERYFCSMVGLDDLQQLDDFAKSRDVRIIIIVDGLEDFFPEIHSQVGSQRSLRRLLQEVVGEFRALTSLGLLCFVREDLVRAAIPQNVEQFLRRYENYKLSWSALEALQLAYWVCKQSDLSFATKDAEQLTLEEAKSALINLWGRRLGSDNSKEADSAVWVLSALSDFQARIQARDLVRLIHFAAAESQRTKPIDRFLAATAIRKSLQETGKQKLQEIKQENPNLRHILERLEQSKDEASVPFQLGEFGLSEADIRTLIDVGLLTQEPDGYFFPEVIRQGLDIKTSKAGRAKVISRLPRIA